MKHIGIKLSLVLATALLGASAFASPSTGARVPFKQRILSQFDANHDGLIGQAEADAMKAAAQQKRAEHKAKVLAQYDTDRDGVLEPAEQQKLAEARKALLLQRFDANKNGVIDPAERKLISQRRAQRRLHRRFVQLVLRYDVNHDNKLSMPELPPKGTKPGGAIKPRFDRIDRNDDGQIDGREFRAAAAKANKAKGKARGKQKAKAPTKGIL